MSLADSPHKDLLREVGWRTRGYLPHFDGLATPQTITLHLADAVPAKVIQRWERQLRVMADEKKLMVLQQRIDKYLDQGYGACFLGNPLIAELVQDSLLKYDGIRYRLFSWCLMPNHEHALMSRFENQELGAIMQAHKSFTAHEANKLLKRKGPFWMREHFDRMIRNSEHFANSRRYIENNPVKAKLCKDPSEWPYSSAWFRKRGGKPGAWRLAELGV